MFRNKKVYSYLLKSLGVILFLIIISKINFSKLLKILYNYEIVFPLVITILFLIFSYYLKALRWKIICLGYSIKISNSKSFVLFLIGTFLGFTTPGRVGELFRANYISENRNSFQNSLVTVISDRAFDLLSLLILAIFSSIFLESKYHFLKDFFVLKENMTFQIIIFSVLMASIIALLLVNKKNSFLKKIKHKIIGLLTNFKAIKVSFNQLMLMLIYTLLSLIIGYGLFYYLAISIGVKIDFLEILSISILVSFIQLIPVSILGIGTRDITLIYFFHLQGLSTELAVSLSFLVLIANLIATTPGMILFLSYRKKST